MPALGTIPVLGALFRSNNFQRGQTELVIIVTPVDRRPAVEPAPGARRPVDSYVPPNDFERILLGRFQGNRQEGEPDAEPHRPAPAASAPSGFVFE